MGLLVEHNRGRLAHASLRGKHLHLIVLLGVRAVTIDVISANESYRYPT